MANILPFVQKARSLTVDWQAVEEERKISFPKVPKKAIQILRRGMESFSGKSSMHDDDSRIDFPDNGDIFSKMPVTLSPRKSDILWVLSLYDRFGGYLSDGKHACTIRRAQKRPPVFLIREISRDAYEGLDTAFGSSYELFFRSDYWKILGKDFTDVDLMGILIDDFDRQRYYYGMFDKQTARLMLARIEEGVPLEYVFLIDI
jgi:hypothetical protein